MFAENRFRPRILIDVSKIDLTTTVFGSKISMPIMVAPIGQHQMAHPEGIDIVSSLLLLMYILLKQKHLILYMFGIEVYFLLTTI